MEEETKTQEEVVIPEDVTTDQPIPETPAEVEEPEVAGAKNWLGMERIKSFSEDGNETIVVMKKGRTYRINTFVFNKMATEKKNENGGYDPELFKLTIIAQDIIGILEKQYDIKQSDIEPLTDFIKHGIKNDMTYAIRALLGKPTHEMKLSDVKKILLDNAEKMANIKSKAHEEVMARMEAEQNNAQ